LKDGWDGPVMITAGFFDNEVGIKGDNGLEVSNGSTGRDCKEGWNDLTGVGVDKVVSIGYGITRFLYLGTIMANNIRHPGASVSWSRAMVKQIGVKCRPPISWIGTMRVESRCWIRTIV